jgi:hypothetical protein
MRTLVAAAVAAGALSLAPAAHAVGGNYTIRGGTKAERKLVVSALNVSSFDWSVVRDRVTIRIAPGTDSRAIRGIIWLDSHLLDAGRFAMGIVQHEYAHEVDFFLFDDAIHAELLEELGGVEWCYGGAALSHADYGCERFASTLAWTYWPSPDNCLRPTMAGEESMAMRPGRFKALMRSIFRQLNVRA